MAKGPSRAEALKAKNPAEFARIVGVDGKGLRSKLRNRGIHVSKNPGAFNAKVKGDLFDEIVNHKAPKGSKKTSKKTSSKSTSKKSKKQEPAATTAE